MIEEIGRINERITVGYDHALKQPFILASSNMIRFSQDELSTLSFIIRAMIIGETYERFIPLLRKNIYTYPLPLWKPIEGVKHI